MHAGGLTNREKKRFKNYLMTLKAEQKKLRLQKKVNKHGGKNFGNHFVGKRDSRKRRRI